MCGQAGYSGQLVVNRNLIVPLFLLCLLVAVPANTFGLTINVVDPGKRYVVPVLPDSGHSNGGGLVAAGQTEIEVCVNPLPLPTAQISVLVYHDNAPLNNQPDLPQFGVGGTELGLEGFSVILHDAAGQVMMDAFGNTADIPSGSDDGGLDEFFEFIPKSRSSSSIRFFNWIISLSNCFIYASLSIK